MRRKIIAGNWKMNNDLQETQNLISRINNELNKEEVNCDVIVCPPFTSLSEAASLIRGTSIKLGAQNMNENDSGAYTGEVSAKMLKSAGCEFIILGHSERRTIYKEDDGLINKKIKQAVTNGLKPIFCIGETLEEREADKMNDVIKRQLKDGLKNLSQPELKNMIIAYEPVWAIGTGRNASPEQAQEVHAFIRQVLKEDFAEDFVERIIIQYGGSVKPDNAEELLSQKDIDGALVGGAALKADSFMGIIKAAGNR